MRREREKRSRIFAHFPFANQIGLLEDISQNLSLPWKSLGQFQNGHEDQDRHTDTHDDQTPEKRLFDEAMLRKTDVENVQHHDVFEYVVVRTFWISLNLNFRVESARREIIGSARRTEILLRIANGTSTRSGRTGHAIVSAR